MWTLSTLSPVVYCVFPFMHFVFPEVNNYLFFKLCCFVCVCLMYLRLFSTLLVLQISLKSPFSMFSQLQSETGFLFSDIPPSSYLVYFPFCWSMPFSTFLRKGLLVGNKFFVTLTIWKCNCSTLYHNWPLNWIKNSRLEVIFSWNFEDIVLLFSSFFLVVIEV